jgi:NADH:ubiquinone oxidoreductase subunit C
MPVTFFTSEALTSNHYVIFIPKVWKTAFITTIKYETATSLSYLVESTIIDTYNYDLFAKEEDYSVEISRFLRIDNYYSLFNRARYSTIESLSNKPLFSGSVVYKNSIWLEREFTEMYGGIVKSIYDTRNLLLEYSFIENPMVKTYPTEGFLDIYYDFFRDQLCYVNHDYVEL